jgi:hypothetical protein
MLTKNGCDWDEETCQRAAANGHFQIVKYAHKNGCPWDESTCFFAAVNGDLNILKYARENGCLWQDSVFYAAASNEFLDILQYANPSDCAGKEAFGRLEALVAAHENCCPQKDTRCGHGKCLRTFDVRYWDVAHHCPHRVAEMNY